MRLSRNAAGRSALSSITFSIPGLLSVTESSLLPPASRGMHMCNKCDQMDNEIEQFRRLISPGMDALSLTMIRCAIELLEADKAAVHCSGIVHQPARPSS